MDERHSIEHLICFEDFKRDFPENTINEDLKKEIEETRRKMRDAFADGKKFRAELRQVVAG